MTTRTVYSIVLLLAVAVFVLVMVKGYRDCRNVGGHYVRGLFWMECVR